MLYVMMETTGYLGPVHTDDKVAFDTVDYVEICRVALAPYTLDVRHSGDKNHPLSTKSTELNMFNFGDNVDRDKLTTNRQQSRKSTRTLSTFDFVAGVYRASDATMQRSSGSEYGNLFNAMKT